MRDDAPKGLTIGAVTRLTGIAADTLRTWERRHAVVEPLRDGERRLYTEAQVERLRTIAALAQRGERVSDLARLSDEELAARSRLHDGVPTDGPVRAVVVHPTVGDGLAGDVPELEGALEVVACAPRADDLPPPRPVDALVLDTDALGPSPARALDALRDRWSPTVVVVTHTFLSRSARRALTRPDVALVRGPTTTPELRRRVIEAARLARPRPAAIPSAPAPNPRFSRARLEALLDLRPSLACECPNHLASLVLQLRGFEDYSRGCARTSPEDAALHDALAEGTGRAASELEALLARVLAHDGLEG